jgi:SAM-dependent methyltransferase
MLARGFYVRLLRLAFHLFYNPFAFTYDFVSALVSRGHWRAWTRAAIPRLHGARILEVPCGTGNLLLDLRAAGYVPIGVDLSAWMLGITRGKFQRARTNAPLVRARTQMLPFPRRAFDSVVMTFPPGFIFDPAALAEIHRVLDDHGRLIWVDAGRLLPRDLWSRALNAALDAVDSGGDFARVANERLTRAGFAAQIEWVEDDASVVAVVTAAKRL